MRRLTQYFFVFIVTFACQRVDHKPDRIFDVHIHGTPDPSSQIAALKVAGVYTAAISTSWNLQEEYRAFKSPELLFGLMFPCPLGKVPYSYRPCFEDGDDWPDIEWVEQQIQAGKINFLGELLNQYYGVTPSDSLMFPFYELAVRYDLPVGIHTGGAGPDHGSPNFQLELGDPTLLKPILEACPSVRLWIMHSGDQYFKETIQLMIDHPNVYADISVVANPDIVEKVRIYTTLKAFYDAGLEDRLMFATDNGDIQKMVATVMDLDFLTVSQMQKLFYKNAETFFWSER
jgi:hypothetical protein